MRIESTHEMTSFESFRKNIVQREHDFRNIACEEEIDQLEIIFIVEHIEVGDGLLISDITLAERCYLVEDGQGIAHTTIRFLRNHVEGSRFVGDAFLLCYFLQMPHDVLHRHPTEIIDLAA